MANGDEFNPLKEARAKWPGLADLGDAELHTKLSDPQNFRAAFPEYAQVPDQKIRENMLRFATTQGFGGAAATAAGQPNAPRLIDKIGQVATKIAQIPFAAQAGALKGAGSTAYNLAGLTNRGIRAILPKSFADQYVPSFPAEKPAILQPEGMAEKAGYGAEQAGEFLLPGGAVSKAGKALQAVTGASRLGRATSLAGQMGLEGLTTAGVATAQGQDAKLAGILGALGPPGEAVAKALLIPAGEKAAARVGNKLLRPRDVQFGFGKNPGEAVSQVGVTANAASLVQKLQGLKQTTGAAIDQALSKPQYAGKIIDVQPLIEKPVNDAIQAALKKPLGAGKQQLIDELVALKDDLLSERQLVGGKVSSAGAKNLKLNPLDATQLKRDIGDSTRWTGSAFDRDVNQVRRSIYSNIRQAVENVAPEVKPLNQSYANALEAQAAAARRATAAERNQVFSLSDLIVGGATGVGRAAVGGGLAGPAYGLGAAAALKGLRSTPARTAEIQALKNLPRIPGRAVRAGILSQKEDAETSP